MITVIVESPTKAKTISKFLGKGYVVSSSYGHIRDLPKSKLGIDIEKDFQPKYIVPLKAKKHLSELKKILKDSKDIILATDEDREGEAIAWHLAELLKIKDPKRIVFHEITKPAIEKALKNPRGIDINLVNAQQARRILDRLVGYKLSPLLWKKIVRGLSAGRVQSIAVRFIADREKEIKAFKPEEYWTIEAELQKKENFVAILIKENDKPIPKLGIKNEKQAKDIVSNLKNIDFEVRKIEKKEVKKNPLPPFTTSSLQQEAWQKFHWPAKMTMSIAQALYEKGYITYHRTDSLNISLSSQEAAKNFIEKELGKNYLCLRTYKTKSRSAQEAHEAIRPTLPNKSPENLKGLDNRQLKLYRLIWQRFIASQMKEAILNSVSVEIKAGIYTFKAKGQTISFDGFLKIYQTGIKENIIPALKVNEKLKVNKITPLQHFTMPPARYNEATLIKALEKEGIGRPSTYAPILETIQRRNYVQKNKDKRFELTEIGLLVNNLLVEHFPEIVNIKFTADMEKNLDEIANGKKDWVKVLKDFYMPFEKILEKKYKEIDKKDLSEKTDKKCPKCGAPLVIKWGRFGKFYACSKFPNCKYTESLERPKLGIKCPQCGLGDIIEKKTRKGKIFYGCSNFPKCDFALWYKPTGEKCPKCGALMVEKGKKTICSNKDCV